MREKSEVKLERLVCQIVSDFEEQAGDFSFVL